MSNKFGTAEFNGSRFVTDGVRFGTVCEVCSLYVVAVDERDQLGEKLTCRKFSIPISQARSMSEDEVESYNATGTPTREEILKRCLEIQSTWSPEVRALRSRCSRLPGVPTLKSLMTAAAA